MDLNDLLFHHQISLIRAASLPENSKAGACRLVKHYQARIDSHRDLTGVSRYPFWSTPSQAACPVS